MKITVTELGKAREVNPHPEYYHDGYEHWMNTDFLNFENSVEIYPAFDQSGEPLLVGEYEAELVWRQRTGLGWTIVRNYDGKYRPEIHEQVYIAKENPIKTAKVETVEEAAERNAPKYYGTEDEYNYPNKAITQICKGRFIAGANWQALQRTEREQRYKELIDFILELDRLTTKEFCDKFNHPLPSWKGNVGVAVSEFLSIDAVKYKMIKDLAKDINKALNQ